MPDARRPLPFCVLPRATFSFLHNITVSLIRFQQGWHSHIVLDDTQHHFDGTLPFTMFTAKFGNAMARQDVHS
jgi:pectate lyase